LPGWKITVDCGRIVNEHLKIVDRVAYWQVWQFYRKDSKQILSFTPNVYQKITNKFRLASATGILAYFK